MTEVCAIASCRLCLNSYYALVSANMVGLIQRVLLDDLTNLKSEVEVRKQGPV